LQTGSITAAARELGLSQPAVSRLLAKLERNIGFQLFHRDRGRLPPTPEALIFLEQVGHALGGIDRVGELARNISANKVGQLKLVAPPSFTEGVLPEIVASFVQRFPDVHLTLESRSVETAKAMIATREVDGGFSNARSGALTLRRRRPRQRRRAGANEHSAAGGGEAGNHARSTCRHAQRAPDLSHAERLHARWA
jgi:DNA-binding transcriptional LysR family regulator